MAYKQDLRLLAMQTDLGPDEAVLTELEGVERISETFLFKIQFVTAKEPKDVTKLLGSAVSIEFGRNPADRRKLHGHIRRLRRGTEFRNGEHEWHAEVVPMLWFLSRTSDCRIFQEKTIPAIIEEMLQLHGVTSFQMKLTGSYQPREYVVQYRESALDFIQRLMEQEGIFYWHEHSTGGHKLVIADDSRVSPPKLPQSYGILASYADVSVERFEEEIVVRSGKWTLRDFNFKTPSTLLEANEPTTIKVDQMKSRERYDYPGIFEQKSAGTGVARHRIENEETFHKVLSGSSGIYDFFAGAQATVSGASVEDLLLTEVRHTAFDHSHWTDEVWAYREKLRGGEPRQRSSSYWNEFVAIPKDVKYRPERVTPRPFVQGPQTAIVTGLAGEEIHTDEFGRVKVQFHWDRLGAKDEHTSCWIRVSQGWAGKGWGQIHIPRIGHEVIVDFLEGDPDRPIITGRVYNAENTVPYGLPANKTQSGIKSNSSKGGGGSNEFRFEDKKGDEQIYVHAQKDLDTEVENNETRHVKVNRTTMIDVDETTEVGGNKKTDVTGNFDETILGTETRKVTGNVTETFMANEDRTIIGNQTETITGNLSQTVTGSLSQTVVGGITVTTPATLNVTAVGGVTFTAPGGFTVLAPGGTRTVDSFFSRIGGQELETFMSQNNITMTKFESNLGVAVSVQGIKMETVHLKMEWVDAQLVNKPMEFADYKVRIKNAVTSVTKAAIKIFT